MRVNPRLSDSESIQRCGFPACRAACCVYGTWIDAHEIADIQAHAALIQPLLPSDRHDPALWFGEERESDRHALSGTVLHTTVLDAPAHYGGSACIFMRPDYKCALQVAGEANGMHPWRFKPFYCILHPLDLDKHGRITLDETHLLVDEPASCLRLGKQEISLTTFFEEELRYLLGENVYEKFVNRV